MTNASGTGTFGCFYLVLFRKMSARGSVTSTKVSRNYPLDFSMKFILEWQPTWSMRMVDQIRLVSSLSLMTKR